MAVLDPLHPLQSAIIETLVTKFPLTIEQLHQQINKTYGIEVSRQNLYRTASQLLAAQLLVREKSALSLNRIWVSHALSLGEQLKRNYFGSDSQPKKFPKENSSKEFKAGSLAQLDPLWTDMLVELSENTRSQSLYAYNSHPWYSIGMRDTEQRVFEGLVSRGAEIHMLYGNETFLDQFGLRLINFPGFHAYCCQNSGFPSEGYALWVGGAYIVEVIFPTLINRQFKVFFDSVRSVEQLDIELFSNIFEIKARCSIKISHDKSRANKLRAKLKHYFT